jgi:DNA modification methylase
MTQAKMVRSSKPQQAFDEGTPENNGTAPRTQTERRANDLDGATWTRNSISVWNDIRKSTEEVRFGHPAMFPVTLVTRLIDSFTTEADHTVLDPFMGSGSTLLAAQQRHKAGVGFEISDEYVERAEARLGQGGLFTKGAPKHTIFKTDALHILDHVKKQSVDFCVTSPPYWDILSQKRTADYKEIRDYGDTVQDLAKISDYNAFLDALTNIFKVVLEAMKPGKYCIVNVMDLRKKDRFFPFHSDLTARMVSAGWVYDDLIIWDRRQEYNNLRPLGYPAVFRINKIHEYLLIFKKPSAATNDHHRELPRP